VTLHWLGAEALRKIGDEMRLRNAGAGADRTGLRARTGQHGRVHRWATHPGSGTVSVLGLDGAGDRGEPRLYLGAQLQDSQLPERLRVGETLKLYS
jgi:hypothetical protein